MQEHISPEEKLLKLIRRKDRTSSKEEDVKKSNAGSANPSAKSSTKGVTSKNNISVILKASDKILLLAVFALSLYIGYELFFTGKNVNTLVKEPLNITKGAGDEAGPIVKTVMPQPSDYYTSPAQARDLFDTAFTKKTDEGKKSVSVSELTKNMRLVGIILGEVSEAIIEDLELRQTFFLHKGESFKNGIIEEIEESKVILSFGNQRVELVQ